MLDNVLRNLISVKHSVKNPKTCLLFPSLMNNDWFVWIACKTLLDSRTQIWANVGPRIHIVCNLNFFLIAFLLLDSFGHRVQHCFTKQCWMVFCDVVLVWTGLWHGEFFFRWPFVAECCIAGSDTDVGLPMYRVKCTNLMSELSKPPVT